MYITLWCQRIDPAIKHICRTPRAALYHPDHCCLPPTVPDTAQITDSQALTSSSIAVQWTEVPSADHYLLQVSSHDRSQTFNRTVSGSSAVVENLTPSTNYDCFVYTLNHAGRGSRSKVRTVTTCEFTLSLSLM